MTVPEPVRQPSAEGFFEAARKGSETGICAGAAAVDVTPEGPVFLYGYPHHPRLSTGVHDRLFASALSLITHSHSVIFVCVDTIWLSKQLVSRARTRIAERVPVPPNRIIIMATHAHSGPTTVRMLSNIDDPVVPPPDPEYLSSLVNAIASAAVTAFRHAEPAEIALVRMECSTIGANRLGPNGPTVETIPVLAARALGDRARLLGLMYVNRVHPTVLHEDSLLISGDFPGLCRRHLQETVLGVGCPVLSPLGAAGNQSPRFVARANTFEEAERLGTSLGEAIRSALEAAIYERSWVVECASISIDLPPRNLPSIPVAEELLESAKSRLAELRRSGSEHGVIRTAECAVFGAEETLCLAKAARHGQLEAARCGCLPAEIGLVRVGPWYFVTWPGEVFAEFALQVRKHFPNAHVITLANGELQGYLATAEAVRDGTYEAANSIFASPAAGDALVNATLELIESHAKSDDA